MATSRAAREAVLRVGAVIGVNGRKIYIAVDRNKNLSHMFLDGQIIRNIAVNSYIDIRKGFLNIIGRVEGEEIHEEPSKDSAGQKAQVARIRRVLTVSLTGFIDEWGNFQSGTRELPLVGNEAFLLTQDQLRRIHDLLGRGTKPFVSFSVLDGEDLEVRLPVDGLFNSHIAVFGNTGSGKSNTVAILYQELCRVLEKRNPRLFRENTRFLLFDFNGEYTAADCITGEKTVYRLTTRLPEGDRLPMPFDALLDVEVLSILADATEKTQKPFLRRAIRFLRSVQDVPDGDSQTYLRNILRRRVIDVLQMSDKQRLFVLLDYFRQIVPDARQDGELVDVAADLEWHNTMSEFRIKNGAFLGSHPEEIVNTNLYRRVDDVRMGDNLIDDIVLFLYLQLISDVLANRAQNEHIAPVINRLRAKRHDIERLFRFDGDIGFWSSNFVVVDLSDVNLDMRKTIPLLLSKRLYAEQKRAGRRATLNIIIDEAHNILSTQSSREAESWKDYRLETFEEIVKEGRKFGVFVTVSSQRPSDISPTISSQAHNYFIHRLINNLDLKTIASAVSYIDRVTEESIPTLPTGTCILSGIATGRPIKIVVHPLPLLARPHSETRGFAEAVPHLEG